MACSNFFVEERLLFDHKRHCYTITNSSFIMCLGASRAKIIWCSRSLALAMFTLLSALLSSWYASCCNEIMTNMRRASSVASAFVSNLLSCSRRSLTRCLIFLLFPLSLTRMSCKQHPNVKRHSLSSKIQIFWMPAVICADQSTAA